MVYGERIMAYDEAIVVCDNYHSMQQLIEII